jgi:hypothetical protein
MILNGQGEREIKKQAVRPRHVNTGCCLKPVSFRFQGSSVQKKSCDILHAEQATYYARKDCSDKTAIICVTEVVTSA